MSILLTNHQMAILELFAALARDEEVAVLHKPGLAARFCTHALLWFGDGTTQPGTCDEVISSDLLGRLDGLHCRRRWFMPG